MSGDGEPPSEEWEELRESDDSFVYSHVPVNMILKLFKKFGVAKVEELPQMIVVCESCGSDRVFNDAWVEANDTESVVIFDSTFCEECDSECGIKEIKK